LHIKLPQPINRFGYLAAHLMTHPIINFINLGVSEDIIRHINQGRGNAKGICKYDLTQIMRQSIGAKGTSDAQRGRNGFGKGLHIPSSFGVSRTITDPITRARAVTNILNNYETITPCDIHQFFAPHIGRRLGCWFIHLGRGEKGDETVTRWL